MSTTPPALDTAPVDRPVMPRGTAARTRPVPGRADPAAEQPAPTDLSRPARIIGTVVAPTSLMTSLFYYFGWSHAYWFFDYFGVNSTLLGLTTGDYLMRSLDALFVPMTALACGALALLWGNAVVPARLRQARWIPRFLAPITGVAGAGLTLIGLSAVFGVRTPLAAWVAVTPLCLAFGVLLIAYAVHLRRQAAPGDPAGPPGPNGARWPNGWRSTCWSGSACSGPRTTTRPPWDGPAPGSSWRRWTPIPAWWSTATRA